MVNQRDLIAALCRFVVDTNHQDLPGNEVGYAKHSTLDTIAVIIGGSAMESVAGVVDLVKDNGGKPESIIPLYGGKVPAAEAGLAIGPMARAVDFGDIHERAGHCREHIVPIVESLFGTVKRLPEYSSRFLDCEQTVIFGGIIQSVCILALIMSRRTNCVRGLREKIGRGKLEKLRQLPKEVNRLKQDNLTDDEETGMLNPIKSSIVV
jgi:hypothetical protein